MKISINVDVYDNESIQCAISFLTAQPGYEPPRDAEPPETATTAARSDAPCSTEAEAVAALHAYVKSHGLPAAVAALQQFGVARVTELATPEARGAFVASVTASE